MSVATAAGTFKIGGDLERVRLGYGAMRITGEGTWGPPDDPRQAVALLRRAVELGVELIDTADAYGPNVSEELIAEALYPYDGLLIATKGGYERTGPSGRSIDGELTGWSLNGRPEHLRAACEGSLRRLRAERIDLYQLHWPDPDVPFDESMGAMRELQQEGKVLHVGVCNVTVEQLALARAVVEIATVQSPFNLVDTSRADLLAECEANAIGFIPYRPLEGGSSECPPERSRRRRNATPRPPDRSRSPGCSPTRRSSCRSRARPRWRTSKRMSPRPSSSSPPTSLYVSTRPVWGPDRPTGPASRNGVVFFFPAPQNWPVGQYHQASISKAATSEVRNGNGWARHRERRTDGAPVLGERSAARAVQGDARRLPDPSD
jgi:aryl-alcohol dehydrogenase-like predicted oxidoreductase